MFNLPKSTEVNRLISKEKLIRKLNLSPALKESLKDDIRKLIITNEMSPKSMNIPRGKDVYAVFLVEMQLKQRDIDAKLVEALGRQIKQKIVFVLTYENTAQLALYYNKLYRSDRMKCGDINLDISGNDFDGVWDGLVGQIALEKQSAVEELNVGELIEKQEQRRKLEREIAMLDKKTRTERQPRRKLECAEKLKKLKRELGQYE